MEELHYAQKEPTQIKIDNKSAIAFAKNPLFYERNKCIDTRFHYIRQCVSNKQVELKHVKTKLQIVDIFIKARKFKEFKELKSKFGIQEFQV